MNPAELELLIEAVASAHRARDSRGNLLPAPAWLDLPPAERSRAFTYQRVARRLEAALDPAGLSSTAHAVLARAARLPQFER